MYNRITAWVCLILAAVIALRGYTLEIGRLENPGPGFMPVTAAILIAFFSVLILLRDSNRGDRNNPFQGILWHRIVLTLLILFLYSFLLQRAGYILTTFTAMAIFFRLIEKPSWFFVLFWSATSSIVSFVIFNTWLEVALPAGFLGF